MRILQKDYGCMSRAPIWQAYAAGARESRREKYTRIAVRHMYRKCIRQLRLIERSDKLACRRSSEWISILEIRRNRVRTLPIKNVRQDTEILAVALKQKKLPGKVSGEEWNDARLMDDIVRQTYERAAERLDAFLEDRDIFLEAVTLLRYILRGSLILLLGMLFMAAL